MPADFPSDQFKTAYNLGAWAGEQGTKRNMFPEGSDDHAHYERGYNETKETASKYARGGKVAGPTKKSLAPFVGKAKLHVHAGKGASETGHAPSRADVASITAPGQPPAGMNNFAKQTPMPSAPPSPAPMGPPGLGTGGFNGIGS